MIKTREFIQKALYKPGTGYFMNKPVILDTTTAASQGSLLRFDDILGKREFEAKVQRLYQNNSVTPQGSWLTPVELFAPWYSYALAESILARHDSAQPLRIYELGAGNGTNALHICNFIQQYRPRLYEKLKYTTIEISPFLADKQRKLLQRKHGSVHQCINADAQLLGIDRQQRGSETEHQRLQDIATDEKCFVLALEVFDNLPHDKVVRKTTKDLQDEWYETWIDSSPNALPNQKRKFQEVINDELSKKRGVAQNETDGSMTLHEVYRPLQDDLIARALDVVLKSREARQSSNRDDAHAAETLGSYGNALLSSIRHFFFPERNESLKDQVEREDLSKAKSIFVPTGAISLLDSLHRMFPQHTLIANDFDMLPSPGGLPRAQHDNTVDDYTEALNEPIVSSKNEATHDTVDHVNYLSPRPFGVADIFFPVDFTGMKWLLEKQFDRTATIADTGDFLTKSAPKWIQMTKTLTGYNPMMEYYHNTKVLLSEKKSAGE
eukprot:gb/GECG01015629.1/.p1 GENE.gb/GECG01015629.1/~~gb/GECG01015629.1/.p1  ORF type:complete len:495 (+),score=59.36 gb/GECG01015629.1/:1-1485(+)